MKRVLGKHLICEFWEIDPDILNDSLLLIKTLQEGCESAGATVLGHLEHQFDPQGITIILLLSESHCSIHTYPELQYASVDIFTCGDEVEPQVALEYIHDKIGSKMKFRRIERGIPY